MWREAAVLAGAAGCACLALSEYEKKHFSVEAAAIVSDKIYRDRTIVFLSDLHNNEFGCTNQKLVQAIHGLKPDAVLCGGDMMVSKKGSRDIQVPPRLFEQLAARYPVFYGNGNHENRMTWRRDIYGNLYEEYKGALQKMGVTYLEDDTVPLGEDILITGVDLDQDFYRKALYQKLPDMERGYLRKKLGPAGEPGDRFRILLAHSPLYFEAYADWGADLTLSGHFHGGTIRIPGLGGVMTPQYQFFLPWCAGDFERDGKRMIVSRGLGTHSINIRLNNRPQLAVIYLKRKQGMFEKADNL